MSYREKPQLKLYKFQDNTFILQAIIDDYQEVSFERNLYQAGVFSISINFNIPNSQLFQRGLFVQFGSDPYDFGEIITIKDQIGEAGKGSQLRTIMGYDSRYIFKRRVIKDMNSNGLWTMTDKGELCLRNLINDQCGTNAEEKRKLPITNVIPDSSSAIGKEYSVSEQFTNLYEVCKTIATQSEIGWRLKFNGTSLSLECYEGEDRSQTVQFSPSFDSLANGNFQDSSESFSNAIYVGGKGQNDDRDIYEGEDGTPSGLNRFESWDNQSSMTSEDEYEAEALSMLTQYGQTIQMSGNGLAKCPYEYKSQYNVGDWITISFNNKSAIVQILSVTEHWLFGSYNIQFSFGKPQNNIQDQLQLMLRKIQSASNKTNSTDSVRWYTIPTDTEMPKADVTYNTIGFIGECAENGSTFKLYWDSEKTGAKTYHVYFKQLAGGKLTLTTGVSGATNLILNSGTYVAIIYVDSDGNVNSQGATATNVIESGNTQPVTSDGVNTITDELETEISGKQPLLTAGANIKINNNVIEGTSDLPTDAVLHYSFDEVPDLPDGTAVYKKDNDWVDADSWVSDNDNTTFSVSNKIASWITTNTERIQISKTINDIANRIIRVKFKISQPNIVCRILLKYNGDWQNIKSINSSGNWDLLDVVAPTTLDNNNIIIQFYSTQTNVKLEIAQIYIGNGSYSTPIIDNAGGKWNSARQSGVAVQGVSGKGLYCPSNQVVDINGFNLTNDFTFSIWVNPQSSGNNQGGIIFSTESQFFCYNGYHTGNNYLYFTLDADSGSTAFVITGSLLPINQFNHLVFTKSGTTVKVYLNGSLLKQQTLSFSNLNQSTAGHIGNIYNSRPQSYDDLLIFDRALTEKEVVALYNNKANTPKYYNLNNYKLPAPPTTDGSYTLNVTVSGGVPSYSWS